ncbi:Uncharacterised protein [Bordetella trematum]|nr:Uncharacterised protein [Bordetella trematum]
MRCRPSAAPRPRRPGEDSCRLAGRTVFRIDDRSQHPQQHREAVRRVPFTRFVTFSSGAVALNLAPSRVRPISLASRSTGPSIRSAQIIRSVHPIDDLGGWVRSVSAARARSISSGRMSPRSPSVTPSRSPASPYPPVAGSTWDVLKFGDRTCFQGSRQPHCDSETEPPDPTEADLADLQRLNLGHGSVSSKEEIDVGVAAIRHLASPCLRGFQGGWSCQQCHQ